MKEIVLAHGNRALVDDEDFERINSRRWLVHKDRKNGCLYAKSSNPVVWMHREIMGIPRGDRREVDHRDYRATLDNRKQNFRVCDRSQNNCNRGMRKDNTSGYKGVSFDRRRRLNPWYAQIMHHKKAYNLGHYATKEEAALVYAEAAKRMHGEFARIAHD